MARARNIKPGFFLNEYLGTCDPLEALLFEGLWLLADRDGRLEFRPLRIKAQIFPYRDLSAQVITGFVRNLSINGFIVLYEVDGNQYIEVCGFLEHQNPHKNEKPSDIPPPPAKTTGCKESSNYVTSSDIIGTAPADSLNPSLLNPSSLNPESSGAKKSAPTARGTRLPADWTLPEDWKAIAKTIRPEWPDHHVQRVADGFRDYWIAKTGSGASKADWLATWRNWCRNDKTQVTGSFNGQHPNSFSGNSGKGNNRSGGSAFDKVLNEINAARQRDNREPMGHHDPTVRPQVDQQLWGGSGPDGGVGSVIEGDYTRDD